MTGRCLMNEGPGVPGADWYALYTRHQHEKTIVRILSNKGFDAFLPVYPVVRRWKDRSQRLLVPLFPCYVFLRGGLDRRRELVTTPGIVSFVGCGGYPIPIPEQEIAAVQQVVEKGLGVQPHPFLRCGDWVRVKAGPLEGFEGILVRQKSLYRLVISVELLEKSAAVEVDAAMVERVSRPPRPTWPPEAWRLGQGD